MYCKNCGKEIADDSKFCQHCGASLTESAPSILKWHRLSKIDWIAILSGLVWLAYWAQDSFRYYSDEIDSLTQLAPLYKQNGLAEYTPSIIQKEAYGSSMAHFMEYAITPLIVAIIIYILAPICYKKYNSWKTSKTQK